jgi:sulfatase maturation enzyme AslB (radical SAM superfamily)
MNQYRFESQEILDKLLYAISALKENDIYLELTSVLNNVNTSRYPEFLEYLYELPGGKRKNSLKATPILLIDKTGKFKAQEEDIKTLEGLTGENRFSSITPPVKYMEYLYKLLLGQKLEYQCYNPIISANYIDQGDVKACTNVLPESVLNVGNIFNTPLEDIVERFGKTKFQKLLLNTKQWVPLCKNCFNFCSIYNLYLNGSLTLDELCENNYMFEVKEVRDMLQLLKDEIDSNKGLTEGE